MATLNLYCGARKFRRIAWAGFSLAALTCSALCASEPVQYPRNFRNWILAGTGVIMPGGPIPESEHGIHRIFANQKAADGYASGDFADGSIIVYELRHAQEKSGMIFEGERRRVDVMIKDSRLYKSTGGWRFERFWGNDETQDALNGSGTACFQCHSKADTHGLVFSQMR